MSGELKNHPLSFQYFLVNLGGDIDGAVPKHQRTAQPPSVLSLSLVRPRWSRIQCYPIDANNLDTVLLLTLRIIVHSLLFRPPFADVAFHHVRWL